MSRPHWGRGHGWLKLTSKIGLNLLMQISRERSRARLVVCYFVQLLRKTWRTEYVETGVASHAFYCPGRFLDSN